MIHYFKPNAVRDLKKLPRTIQKRILQKLDFYCNVSEPLKFAERLTDQSLGSFRFRIGEYRVIFDLDTERRAIVILTIGHRREIYR